MRKWKELEPQTDHTRMHVLTCRPGMQGRTTALQSEEPPPVLDTADFFPRDPCESNCSHGAVAGRFRCSCLAHSLRSGCRTQIHPSRGISIKLNCFARFFERLVQLLCMTLRLPSKDGESKVTRELIRACISCIVLRALMKAQPPQATGSSSRVAFGFRQETKMLTSRSLKATLTSTVRQRPLSPTGVM